MSFKKEIWRHRETSISASFVQQILTGHLLDAWYCLYPRAMEINEFGSCPQKACRLVEDVQGTKSDRRTEEETKGTQWWTTTASGYQEGSKLFLKMQVSKHPDLVNMSALNWVTIIIHTSPQYVIKIKINSLAKRSMRRERDWLQRYSSLRHRNVRGLDTSLKTFSP